MNLATLQQWARRSQRGIVIERSARIKREGSPVFVWTPAAIAAGAHLAIEVRGQFPASRKYEPLDSIEIVNNEAANDLTLTINGTEQRYIPAGTIKLIHGRGVALWHLDLENLGGVATTLGQIVISLQKEPYTIDKWAADRS